MVDVSLGHGQHPDLILKVGSRALGHRPVQREFGRTVGKDAVIP